MVDHFPLFSMGKDFQVAGFVCFIFVFREQNGSLVNVAGSDGLLSHKKPGFHHLRICLE